MAKKEAKFWQDAASAKVLDSSPVDDSTKSSFVSRCANTCL